MTPATNNRNAQAFWEAAYLVKLAKMPASASPEFIHVPIAAAYDALRTWIEIFGTPEERVQFEEWQQAQDAGNEGQAGA